MQEEIARENGRSLAVIQKEIAPELEVAYAPIEQEQTLARTGLETNLRRSNHTDWNRLGDWSRASAQAKGGKPAGEEGASWSALAPDDRAANDLSLLATPSESPVENPDSSAAVIALNDRAGIVTVDNGGNLSGLDDVPAPTRDDIAKALLSERIARPAILKELAGKENALRGSETAQLKAYLSFESGDRLRSTGIEMGKRIRCKFLSGPC